MKNLYMRGVRACRLLGVCALLSGAGVVFAQTQVSFAGVWQVTEYHPEIRTTDGQLPPLSAEGQTAYATNLERRRVPKARSDMSRCVPSGTPRAMFAPLPLLIVQTARKITLIQEYQHQLRHIYMDEALPALDDIELSYMGESVGRWEGDTLVVETIGLHRDTVLDHAGLPHSRAMKITERLRLLDGGRQLENLMTFDDPALYTTPWTTRVVYDSTPGVELKEYNCLALYEDL